MKVLVVTTISDTVNAFLIPHIKMLIDQGNIVDVAFNIEKEVKPEITEMGCTVYILPFQRFPVSKDNYRAYKELKNIILKEKYDIVHTHTPVASAIVRLACKNIKNIQVIYSAHGFHFFKGAPLKNWLVYYPIERWLSRYTDVFIATNHEDYERAQKSFRAGKVEFVPGVGLNTKRFMDVVVEKSIKRRELGLPEDAFVILSVGEINSNKNHIIIVKAIAKLNNAKIHYVICGDGPLEIDIKNTSKELSIENQVHLIGFRNDIPEICKASDVFAFPSYREGLGMSALEAMASGLPLVTSNIRGVTEYSVDGVTGFICDPNDSDAFAKAFETLFRDTTLRMKMSNHNIEAVEPFDLENVKKMLEVIYEKAMKSCKKDEPGCKIKQEK